MSLVSPACAAPSLRSCLACDDPGCRCYHHKSRHCDDKRSETVEGAAFAERMRALGSGDYLEPPDPPGWDEL